MTQGHDPKSFFGWFSDLWVFFWFFCFFPERFQEQLALSQMNITYTVCCSFRESKFLSELNLGLSDAQEDALFLCTFLSVLFKTLNPRA